MSVERKLNLTSRWSAWIAMIVGTVGLLGWLLDLPVLRGGLGHWPEIRELSAYGFIFASGSCLLLANDPNRLGATLGWVLAAVVFTIGVVSAVQPELFHTIWWPLRGD